MYNNQQQNKSFHIEYSNSATVVQYNMHIQLRTYVGITGLQKQNVHISVY